MASSAKKPLTSIDWRKVLTYDITTSWKPAIQADILLYIAEMLAEGFNLVDIFPFLIAIYPKFADSFQAMQADLLTGHLFSETVGKMQIKGTIRYQIQTVEQFGDLSSGLKIIANYLNKMAIEKKKFRQTLTYPLSLVVLMIGMLVAMRTFMLPQLASMTSGETTNRLVNSMLFLLTYLPQIMLVACGLIIVAFLIFLLWRKQTSPLKQAQFYVRLPVIGGLIRLYYSYFFAYEFSQLFRLGYSVQHIIGVFTEQQEVAFLADFGRYLQAQYEVGKPFAYSLAEAGVFTNEFAAITQQGELLNQLAVKMTLYSQRCLRQYYEGLNRNLKIIQNSLFVMVALSVVSVYLVLMLPMLTMISQI